MMTRGVGLALALVVLQGCAMLELRESSRASLNAGEAVRMDKEGWLALPGVRVAVAASNERLIAVTIGPALLVPLPIFPLPPSVVETRREGLWVHYRFANPSDPVLKAVGDAVRHALTHMDVVHRDADRLKKKNGCCLPARGEVVGPSCCAGEPIAMHVSR